MDIQILYEDKDLLFCRKPTGIPSQPGPSGQPDLLTALSSSYPNIHLIHRLDTPTGGIMVFGLSQRATAKLGSLVQDHSLFKKEYLAVLSKRPQDDSGELRDFLYHDKRANKAYVTDSARKGSKEAILNYKIISTAEDGHALALIHLHTGRTHQIRVQFASRGFPLVGDGKYGSREKCPYIGLWAYKLSFDHPITEQNISCAAKPDISLFPWSLFSESIEQI